MLNSKLEERNDVPSTKAKAIVKASGINRGSMLKLALLSLVIDDLTASCTFKYSQKSARTVDQISIQAKCVFYSVQLQ